MNAMVRQLLNAVLAVASDRETLLRHMAREFQQRHAEANWFEVFIFLAVLATFVIVVWYLGSMLTAPPAGSCRPNPRKLFWQLARAHGLSSIDTLHLWQKCRLAGVENPLEIFVLPDVFDRLTAVPGTHQLGELAAWKSRLFQGLVDEVTSIQEQVQDVDKSSPARSSEPFGAAEQMDPQDHDAN